MRIERKKARSTPSKARVANKCVPVGSGREDEALPAAVAVPARGL